MGEINFEDPFLTSLSVSMHVEIDHWMPAVFELDRHKAAVWRRPGDDTAWKS